MVSLARAVSSEWSTKATTMVGKSMLNASVKKKGPAKAPMSSERNVATYERRNLQFTPTEKK